MMKSNIGITVLLIVTALSHQRSIVCILINIVFNQIPPILFFQSNSQDKCEECFEPTYEYKSYSENPSSYPTNTILKLLQGFPNIPGLFLSNLPAQLQNQTVLSNSTISQNVTEEYNNKVFNNVHFEYEIFDSK